MSEVVELIQNLLEEEEPQFAVGTVVTYRTIDEGQLGIEVMQVQAAIYGSDLRWHTTESDHYFAESYDTKEFVTNVLSRANVDNIRAARSWDAVRKDAVRKPSTSRWD